MEDKENPSEILKRGIGLRKTKKFALFRMSAFKHIEDNMGVTAVISIWIRRRQDSKLGQPRFEASFLTDRMPICRPVALHGVEST